MMESLWNRQINNLIGAVESSAAECAEVVERKYPPKDLSGRRAKELMARRKTNSDIVDALRKNGRTLTSPLAKILKKERCTILRHLVEMLDEGTVVRHGSPSRYEWEAA